MSKLVKIGDLSKILDLTSYTSKKNSNYVLRYWEKEFKQIRPKFINKRRYYSASQVEVIKLIKFLLKNKGMTIKGAKDILNLKINKLDDHNSHGLKAEYYKSSFISKSKSILNKIKRIKKNGKKNSLKS